jgi:DNA-binding NarL/FixJ family response regulator
VLPTRVAIVDDHRFLAQTLALALQDADFDAVLIDPADDVVLRISQWDASVVLLDLNLEREVSGDQLIPALSGGRAVVVLTAENDQARWGECLLAGAVGVLAKSSPLEDVVTAVSLAARGEAVVTDAQRITWLRAADHRRTQTESALAPFRRLTPREEQVLAALVDGEPAVAIAERATVSEATVRSHIRSVLSKLGVGSQLQAVAKARRAGWSRDQPMDRQSHRG